MLCKIHNANISKKSQAREPHEFNLHLIKEKWLDDQCRPKQRGRLTDLQQVSLW